MRIVEVFAEVGCPFTHVGLRHLVAERERRGRNDVVIRVRSWPLEIVNGAPLDPHHLAIEIEALRASVAPELFAGFDRYAFPSTTMPAMALSALANAVLDHREAEAVALDVRWALFEQGQNVARDDVLEAIAERHGLHVAKANRDQVLVDHVDGRSREVSGSPHFFVGHDSDGVFCPTLEIGRDAAGFHVELDQAALDRFHDAVFD